MSQSIKDLSVKILVKVLAKLRGGEIGFDPYRDERTNKKEKLLAFILKEYANDAIIAAVDEVVSFAAVDAGELAKINPEKPDLELPDGLVIDEAAIISPEAIKHIMGEFRVRLKFQRLGSPGPEEKIFMGSSFAQAKEQAHAFIHAQPSMRALDLVLLTPDMKDLREIAKDLAAKVEKELALEPEAAPPKPNRNHLIKADGMIKKRKGANIPEIPAEQTPASPEDAKLQALKALLNPALDETKVRAICDERAEDYVGNILEAVNARLAAYDGKIEALTQRKPVVEKIIIERPDKPAIEFKEKVNPAFHEILSIAEHYPNIMLVGPAGCGKTHLARQVSLALGKSFATISGSAGISESHFTGRLLPTGDGGKFEYTESPFISEYSRENGCFLIDEFDALDPNCIMVCQGATANGGFTVEARKAAGLDPWVTRGKNALLIASANTYGTGADSLYVGRFQQDAAANDRWYFIPVDYDRDLEATLAPDEVCDFVWGLREKVQEHKIRRVVSTRMIQKAAAARAAKRPMKEIRERMLAGWTKEERSKCGV